MSVIKLPTPYHRDEFSWTQWVTYKCNLACPYCIMSHRDSPGGATKWKPEEMTGDEIIEFWNSIDHKPGKKLGIIGGEPTLHKDFSKIIKNLEGYYITFTTNCVSKFYKDDSFVDNLRSHPSSQLRANTSFHPGGCTVEKYLHVVKTMLNNGIFVDQTSFVYTPQTFKKYTKEIQMVDAELKKMGRYLHPDVFMGFWTEADGFDAAMTPTNIWPRDPKDISAHQLAKCDIYDIERYKEATSKSEKTFVKNCKLAFEKMLVDPQGYVYSCHYKLYHGIDPMCHNSEMRIPKAADARCNHYGFCLPCNYPNEKILSPNDPVVVNKLFNQEELDLPEIQHVERELRFLSETKKIDFNYKELFETAMLYLYTGHRHFGNVLLLSSRPSLTAAFLKEKKYRVFNGLQATSLFRKAGKKLDLVLASDYLSQIEDEERLLSLVDPMMAKGGMVVFTFDYGDSFIKDDETCVMTAKELHKLTEIFKSRGYVKQGATNYSNVELDSANARPDGGSFAYGFACYRKEL